MNLLKKNLMSYTVLKLGMLLGPCKQCLLLSFFLIANSLVFKSSTVKSAIHLVNLYPQL